MKRLIQRLLSRWLPIFFVLAVGSRADAQNVCANVNTFCGARIIGGGGGGSGDLLSTNNLSDVASASTSRTNLGLAIGTNVQAYNANLASLAGLTFAADKCTYWSAAATANTMNCTTAGRSMIGAADAAAQTALLSAMVGDSGAGGTKGLVPAPGIGDSTKFLKGDGTWASATASITGTDTHVTFFDGANNPAGDAGLTYNKTTDVLTTAGAYYAANGSQTAPSYAFTNGTNSGLYWNSGSSEMLMTFGGTAKNVFSSTSSQFTNDIMPVGSTSTATVGNAGARWNGLLLRRTITAGGTTGAQTINLPSGTVNFAAAATSIVVTNSLVSTTSIIFTTIRTADTTCTFVKSTVPAAGSFTITLNAGCAAETSVGFMVMN